MEHKTKPYLKIYPHIMKELDISMEEYGICYAIFCLSKNRPCTASKKYLSQQVRVTERHVYTILDKLVEKGLIIRNKRKLNTTCKWDTQLTNEIVKNNHTTKLLHDNYEESSEESMKLLQKKHEETSDNINNRINNKSKDTNSFFDPEKFEEIWLRYPYKSQKKLGMQMYKDTIFSEEDNSRLHNAISVYNRSDVVEEGKFLKRLDTFLSDGYWIDMAKNY